MRILYWDIETAPIVYTGWGLFNQNICYENILQDWYMICAAWRWEGESKIHTASVLEGEKDTYRGDIFVGSYCDDTPIVEKLHAELSKADVIIAHNGDHFDLKKFNVRALDQGFDPLPPIQSVDTLKIARSQFKFTSNRLDYLGQFFGVGQKVENPKGLWKRALLGDRKAIKQMIKYNKGDIDLLHDVYKILRPFDRRHPNWNHTSHGGHVCPNCGSEDLQRRGVYRTRITERQRYRCNGCGAWSSSGKMISKNEIR